MIIGIDPAKIMTIASMSKQLTNINVIQLEVGTFEFYDYFRQLKYQSAFGTDGAIYIEDVHSMPTDGKKAAFSFGYSIGNLHACLRMMQLNFNLVTPQKWRKYTNTKTKQDSIDYIKRHLPNVSLKASERAKKDNHNIADALCIMLYGAMDKGILKRY